jgi:hypothetical protein
MDYHNWEKGKKLLYYDDGGTPTIVHFTYWDTYCGQYDVIFVEEFGGYILPSDVMTKEQIDDMFKEE